MCPFAESDAVVNPTGGLAAANAYPGLGSLPSRILGAPAMGQQVIMQQQSQIETIKQVSSSPHGRPSSQPLPASSTTSADARAE